jgi:large subunit ribosomal protein L31
MHVAARILSRNRGRRREEDSLKQHPRTQLVDVHCASCGASFTTKSTATHALAVDVCSNCHPAYTGRERTVSTGSRTERFNRRRALAVR